MLKTFYFLLILNKEHKSGRPNQASQIPEAPLHLMSLSGLKSVMAEYYMLVSLLSMKVLQ